MRPAPSLHYVSTLLDHRRRRYHRARRLWGTSLLLLGLGLLLGWWVTLRRSPSATPQAVAVSPPGLPALPSGPPGIRLRAVEPRWGFPVLLESGACQDCACQTLAPGRTVCTLGDVVTRGCPPLSWCTTEPAWRPWELALPEREPWLAQREGTLSLPPLPGVPTQGNHPTERFSSPACAAAPCPAVPAVGRPAAAAARPPQRRRPRGRRLAGPRRPAQPVPSQGRMAASEPPFLAEPEGRTASP